ncbi:polysaccharide biosynthesis/export family protein [Novosphingobium soli]|uniref:Polysaccharide biosynthesis/export family protein n=1 Tax=Novosphingobium soli TaxID=574956 RepID=A0ABV6CY25_9SPHN
MLRWLRERFDARGAAGALVLLTAGCASAGAPPLDLAEAAKGMGAYHLGAGDRLRVIVYDEPGLSGEFTVSSAGELAFPLVGSIAADGLTADQLAGALASRIADGYMNDPKVSAEVVAYRPFYILGEVQRPGQYPYVAGMTVEQAVAAAGGFSYRAQSRRVNLRRGAGEAERSVDIGAGQAVAVMPGDTIRVLERYF